MEETANSGSPAVAEGIFKWINLGPLEQGALIICAIAVVLTFLLVFFGHGSPKVVLSFVLFAVVVMVVALVGDKNGPLSSAFTLPENDGPVVAEIPPVVAETPPDVVAPVETNAPESPVPTLAY